MLQSSFQQKKNKVIHGFSLTRWVKRRYLGFKQKRIIRIRGLYYYQQTTKDIPGYGEKQDDDILHNYTVAKIFTYGLRNSLILSFTTKRTDSLKDVAGNVCDGSGNTVYNNVLDSNGEIQWVPQLGIAQGNVIQEYPYNIRYLDQQGNLLTKQQYDDKLPNESVYIAAYVGCTYHCG